MSKNYTKHWKDEVYEIDFYYYFGNYKNFLKDLKANKINSNHIDPAGSMIYKDSEVWIYIKKGKKSSVLVHEAVHAAQYVFNHIGQDVTIANSENFAYYVEAIYKMGANPLLKGPR